MPVLIKEIKTGQINKYFYVKTIFRTFNYKLKRLILCENAQCVCAKSSFSSQMENLIQHICPVPKSREVMFSDQIISGLVCFDNIFVSICVHIT